MQKLFESFRKFIKESAFEDRDNLKRQEMLKNDFKDPEAESFIERDSDRKGRTIEMTVAGIKEYLTRILKENGIDRFESAVPQDMLVFYQGNKQFLVFLHRHLEVKDRNSAEPIMKVLFKISGIGAYPTKWEKWGEIKLGLFTWDLEKQIELKAKLLEFLQANKQTS